MSRRPSLPAHLADASQPWWRTRFMWLVVAGPLVVVVAGIATAVLAVRGADDILDPAQITGSGTDAPALKARNHAATPVR